MLDPNAIEIPIHNGRTKCVAFRPDGHLVGGGPTSGNLRQWKVDGREVDSSAMKASGSIYAVVTSTDGRWIVSGGVGIKLIVWNAVTHQKAIEISDHASNVYSVDVSSDSTRVASGCQDSARIFDIISGTRVIPSLQHDGPVTAVKFSPDGSRIATVTYQRPVVRVYDTLSGNKLFEIPVQVEWAPVTPFAWSTDGQLLFIATSGKITYFDISTSSRSEWPVHNGDANASIVSHGRFLACSAGSSVSFWDCTSRQQIGSILNHTERVNCISISHDGKYLACGRDNGITVYDLIGLLPQIYFRDSRYSRIPLMEVNDTVLESWMGGNPRNTEAILVEEIVQCSNPSHYMLALRSLVRSHLSAWEIAIKDAELSLEIKPSPIGHIARSLALVGAGKQEAALDDFDFVFRDGDPSDNVLLLVTKSILVFLCGRRKQAVSRLLGLITSSGEGCYSQVLANMYLKLGEYENAAKTLKHAKNPSTSQVSDPLVTISVIFNWNFDNLEAIARQCQCEALYTSGRIKELGETLESIVSTLAEDAKEPTHGRILQEIVTRTGQATLLMWTGKPSSCNSCLPSSPAVYSQSPFVSPCLEGEEMRRRTDELRAVLPLTRALVIYGRVTRLQPVRFAHFRLLLPCVVFSVTHLKREEANAYCAKTIGLGDVQFTTTDLLPLEEARKLVFADLRIHGFQQLAVDAESNLESVTVTTTDPALVRAPIIEEAPSAASDTYTQALELMVRLGQPFSALLLLQQPDGSYKRVATDHEIVVHGMENNVPEDIHVKVLEIL